MLNQLNMLEVENFIYGRVIAFVGALRVKSI